MKCCSIPSTFKALRYSVMCEPLHVFHHRWAHQIRGVVPLWHPYGRRVWYLALASYECSDEVEKKQVFRTCAISSWTICSTTLVFFKLPLPLPVCFSDMLCLRQFLTRKFSLFVNTSLTRSGDVPWQSSWATQLLGKVLLKEFRGFHPDLLGKWSRLTEIDRNIAPKWVETTN